MKKPSVVMKVSALCPKVLPLVPDLGRLIGDFFTGGHTHVPQRRAKRGLNC